MEDSQQKDYSFFGNDTFPSLYDAQVYEQKFKSEYLERQFYERLFKSEPSIEKLIKNKSDLSKLSTLSEPFIVKFIENQSEHLSKLTLYHLKHGAILYNEAEVFSLSITNPNGRPMLPFDWLIQSSLILVRCHEILFSRFLRLRNKFEN